VAAPLPVLIVDDARSVRTALVRLLRRAGITCIEAESVAAAAQVDATAIACALLDLDLEDGTGVDIAKALRARRPDLPIAFFSAASGSEVVFRALRVGAVFEKPDGFREALAWVVASARGNVGER